MENEGWILFGVILVVFGSLVGLIMTTIVLFSLFSSFTLTVIGAVFFLSLAVLGGFILAKVSQLI